MAKKSYLNITSELDKLQKWLEHENLPYEREDCYVSDRINLHEIYFPNKKEHIWDAVCHVGSYGYSEGLLEIYGSIVPDNYGDTVIGNLKASDVVNLFIQSDCFKDWLGDK